ncbi:MAG: nucleotide exchange factor GrpE [Anaerolineales bacterium]|nr:nucleotide exchange factor GrpE [Anaerolineales bacterium]
MSDEIENKTTTPEDEILENQAPEESHEDLKTQNEELQLKVAEYLDGWQRSQAEFSNYKKRIEREKQQMYQNAVGNVIKRYLDIMDDLERALKNCPDSKEGAEWAAGIDLIYRKFVAALEAEGVKIMDAQGQLFDPNMHEAISHEDCNTVDSGQIIEVVKQGYLMGDQILRPASVRVAK